MKVVGKWDFSTWDFGEKRAEGKHKHTEYWVTEREQEIWEGERAKVRAKRAEVHSSKAAQPSGNKSAFNREREREGEKEVAGHGNVY